MRLVIGEWVCKWFFGVFENAYSSAQLLWYLRESVGLGDGCKKAKSLKRASLAAAFLNLQGFRGGFMVGV